MTPERLDEWQRVHAIVHPLFDDEHCPICELLPALRAAHAERGGGP